MATGHFSPAAESFCQQVSRRVVLIDGLRLARVMIRFNVGVVVKQSFQIKRIDPEYFRRRQMPPAEPAPVHRQSSP